MFEHFFGVARGEWRAYSLLKNDDVALRTAHRRSASFASSAWC